MRYLEGFQTINLNLSAQFLYIFSICTCSFKCCANSIANQINNFKVMPSSDLSLFSRCKGEKVHHRLHINYQGKLIMPSACSQAKVICHPIFFLCSSVFSYLCSVFSLTIWWHVHFSITLPWHHQPTLLFFHPHSGCLFNTFQNSVISSCSCP